MRGSSGTEVRAVPLSGLILALAGAMAFSGKAIIVKLAYRYGVDAVTLFRSHLRSPHPRYEAIARLGLQGGSVAG